MKISIRLKLKYSEYWGFENFPGNRSKVWHFDEEFQGETILSCHRESQ